MAHAGHITSQCSVSMSHSNCSLQAAHCSTIDMEDLRGHPFRVIATKITEATIDILAGPCAFDHPLLYDLLKGLRRILALRSFRIDRSRSDGIAGNPIVGNLLGQTVGKLVQRQFAD